MNNTKKVFKYETHLHTKEGSACATGTGAEMARAHKEAGYDGIIVTDHFFNGNTAVDRGLSWEDRVNLFCKGYENALDEGNRIGLTVFFGWEYAYHGTEFLTYGLNKEFLLENPDILEWSLDEYFDKVHKNGGFLSHAHPFREASYISEIRLYPDKVDAVEVINTSHQNPIYDEKALQYAKDNNLLFTSGSDTHHINWLTGGGMEFYTELITIDDFIKTVKSKNYRLLNK